MSPLPHASPEVRPARRIYLASPAVWQDRSLRDHHDAVEHFPIVAGDSLDLFWVANDLGVRANVAVFINDGVFDDGTVADSNWWSPGGAVGFQLGRRFVEVDAHDY